MTDQVGEPYLDIDDADIQMTQIQNSLNRVRQQLNYVQAEIRRLERYLSRRRGNVHARLDNVDRRMEILDHRMDRIERRILVLEDHMWARIELIEERIRQQMSQLCVDKFQNLKGTPRC